MSTIDAIAQQEVLLKQLEKAQKKDTTETQKIVNEVKRKTHVVDEEAVYKNFTVSYVDENGEVQEWVAEGPLTLADLTRHAAAVATTVATRLQGKAIGAAQGRSRLEIIRAFKQRSEDRATKMFHCRERIARLKAGEDE
jgi:hypothetical protein